jgi:hypothetical protein
MVYHHPWVYYPEGLTGKRLGPCTMAITHVDDLLKLRMLREALHTVADVGVCLSRETVDELARKGIPREKLTFVTPGHDSLVKPRRVVIGITTRLYPDGRKRERLLTRLAAEMRLDAFQFEIFGAGWDRMIPVLDGAGACVRYEPGTDDIERDYEVLVERIPSFDYYLYLGLDEGSIGTLDALAAGVPTIVPAHGFHLDIPAGITHVCQSYEDLRSILSTIADGRRSRIDGVHHLTWGEYARQHAVLWRALLEGRSDEMSPRLGHDSGYATAPPAGRVLRRVAATAAFYRQTSRSHFLPAVANRFLAALRKKVAF